MAAARQVPNDRDRFQMTRLPFGFAFVAGAFGAQYARYLY
jgi:hypothetical protein